MRRDARPGAVLALIWTGTGSCLPPVSDATVTTGHQPGHGGLGDQVVFASGGTCGAAAATSSAPGPTRGPRGACRAPQGGQRRAQVQADDLRCDQADRRDPAKHKSIIDAIAAGDANLAVERSTEHMRQARRRGPWRPQELATPGMRTLPSTNLAVGLLGGLADVAIPVLALADGAAALAGILFAISAVRVLFGWACLRCAALAVLAGADASRSPCVGGNECRLVGLGRARPRRADGRDVRGRFERLGTRHHYVSPARPGRPSRRRDRVVRQHGQCRVVEQLGGALAEAEPSSAYWGRAQSLTVAGGSTAV